MLPFTIGQANADRLTLAIDGATAGAGKNHWEWANAQIQIRAGGFTAAYKAQFLTQEIADLRADLETLYQNLSGTLHFRALEEHLEIKIAGNGRGQFVADCVAIDKLGSHHRLEFRLEFDQTFLPGMLRELEQIIAEFSL